MLPVILQRHNDFVRNFSIFLSLILCASACGASSETVAPTTTLASTTTATSTTTVASTTTLLPYVSTTTISTVVDDSLPSAQALADGKQIFASFEGNGFSVLNSFVRSFFICIS